jgi:hypothetical protein
LIAVKIFGASRGPAGGKLEQHQGSGTADAAEKHMLRGDRREPMGQSNSLGDIGRRALVTVLAALALLFATGQAGAATQSEQGRYQELFPEATRFGPAEGAPPAIAAFRGDELLGYVFSTRQVIDSVGYSGKPLDILAGVDLQARLTGAILLAHQEPILMIGVSDADLAVRRRVSRPGCPQPHPHLPSRRDGR